MPASVSRRSWTMALTAGALALQASAAGEPQRTGTVTTVTKPAPKAPQSLEERLAALEKRVDDLEKGEVADFKNEQEDDAKAGRIEERLSALERGARDASSRPGSSADVPSTGAGVVTRVQAPFEVVSRDGRPIARIVEWGDLAGGVYVFGKSGGNAVAILGPIKDEAGGRVAVFQADGTGSALAAVSQGSTLSLNTPGSKASILMQSAGQIDLFNKGGTAAFSVTARTAGNGRLTLGDAAGNTVVEAGSTLQGIGIVRVGPRLGGTTGVSQGGMVLPNAIVGQK
jgi:hypothetical protein